MIQIIIFAVGLFLLIGGKLKASSSKEIIRPQSTYLGLIYIAYSLSLSFFSVLENPVLAVSFIGSLILVSAVFISKGKPVDATKVATSSTETRRNLLILLVSVVIMVAIFYLLL